MHRAQAAEHGVAPAATLADIDLTDERCSVNARYMAASRPGKCCTCSPEATGRRAANEPTVPLTTQGHLNTFNGCGGPLPIRIVPR